jgi:transcriptional regulator with XRE-family HTH domain
VHAVSDLTLLRLERDLTLRDAAEQIGISKSTLHRLERAPKLHSQDLHPRTAYRIARFYNVDIRKVIVGNCDMAGQ